MNNLLNGFVDNLIEFGNMFLDKFTHFTVIYGAELFFAFLLIYFVSKTLRDNDATRLMFLYWIAIVGGGVFVLFGSSVFDRAFFRTFLLLVSAFMLIMFSTEVKKSLWDRHNSKTPNKTAVGVDGTSGTQMYSVEQCINDIVRALQNMSKSNTGALIVLSKGNIPKQVLESGVRVYADISSQLIEGIFFPKSPLHDGAMVIRGHKIQAAGCFLPLTQKSNYPKEFGTRHRAGIGITEVSNVVSIIVSEETGIISVVNQGQVQRYADHDMLVAVLRDYYWQELPLNDKQSRKVAR